MTSDSPFCLWVVDSFVNGGFSTWTHQTAAMGTTLHTQGDNHQFEGRSRCWLHCEYDDGWGQSWERICGTPSFADRDSQWTRPDWFHVHDFKESHPSKWCRSLLFLFENVFYSNANVSCPQDVFFDCVWSHRHFIAYYLKSIGHACSYLDRRPWITAQEWVFTAPKGDLPRSLRRLHHIFPTRPVATGVALGVATAVGVEPSRCSGYRSISKPWERWRWSRMNPWWSMPGYSKVQAVLGLVHHFHKHSGWGHGWRSIWAWWFPESCRVRVGWKRL